jgi:hypothetical protein
MFVVHDFTYEPLNFQKICLRSKVFQNRATNFVLIRPKTPMSMNFYVGTRKYLGKNADHNLYLL